MKRVVVLTDFSDNAWNALFTALKLYENEKVLFNIVHFFEPSYADVLSKKNKERLAVLYESLSKNSIMKLEEMEDYLKLHHKNTLHQFNTISIGDDLIDGLIEFLKKNRADLIVLGTRGATKSREVFMGSNAVKVVRKIKNYPILAVPGEHDFKRLSTILFPTDLSHSYYHAELGPLKTLAQDWKSELILFQVSQEPELNEEQIENKANFKKEFEDLEVNFQFMEMEVNIKESIKAAVENNKADMTALIHYPHTFMERLTREPVVNKMAFHSKVPLLVLPERSF